MVPPGRPATTHEAADPLDDVAADPSTRVARLARIEDLDALIALRLEYIRADLLDISDAEAAPIVDQLTRWIPENLGSRFFAALAEVDETPASVAMLAVNEFPGNPSFPNGRVGTVLNVWTRAPYRRRGLATATMRLLIEVGRQQELSKLELLSSDMGMPLYASLGFRASEDEHRPMGLRYPRDPSA